TKTKKSVFPEPEKGGYEKAENIVKKDVRDLHKYSPLECEGDGVAIVKPGQEKKKEEDVPTVPEKEEA
ncbi:hypothetical protein A2U01_0118379, partial [Trifolium medium]|nr:hypothetical protein [Trifolium medium]